RLVERLAVDQEVPLRGAAAHRLTTDGDHPLDQVVLVGGQDPDDPTDVLQRPEYRIVRTDGLVALVPGVRSLEHHDVALLRLTEPIADLVDEYPVAGTADAPVQRGLHGLRRDLVDATDEGLEDEHQHQGDHHEHRDLDVPGLALLLGLLGRAAAAATVSAHASSRGPVAGPRLEGIGSG